MASKLTAAAVPRIGIQSPVDSIPVDKAEQALRVKINEVIDALAAVSIGTTNAETTASRPFNISLKGRLDSILDGHPNVVKDGGTVAERTTPDMKVRVEAINANITGIDVHKGFGTWTRSGAIITMTENNHGRASSDIIDVDVTSEVSPTAIPLQEYTITVIDVNIFTFTGIDAGDTSGSAEYATIGPTIAVIAPTTNKRFDVVVMGSNNNFTILTGTESVDRVFPTVAANQKPLAYLDLDPATTSLNGGVEIIDARNQGAIYFKDGGLRYNWKIQGAIDDITSGEILIARGSYFEELILTAKNNIALVFEPGAILSRISATSRCIKSINTVSNETTGIKIIGGDLRGNGKIGAIELLKFDFTDEFIIKDCKFDGNTSSTATFKNYLIDNSDSVRVQNPILINGISTQSITNSTKVTVMVEDRIIFGNDTNLYRSAANTLKSDDAFIANTINSVNDLTADNRLVVDGNLGKNTVNITSTGTDVGITIGGDVKIFRSLATELKVEATLKPDAADIAGNFAVNGVHKVRNTLDGNLSENTIFDAISPLLPVGDFMVVSGGITVASGGLILSKVERSTSTIMLFHGIKASDGLGQTLAVQDGDATTHNIAMTF